MSYARHCTFKNWAERNRRCKKRGHTHHPRNCACASSESPAKRCETCRGCWAARTGPLQHRSRQIRASAVAAAHRRLRRRRHFRRRQAPKARPAPRNIEECVCWGQKIHARMFKRKPMYGLGSYPCIVRSQSVNIPAKHQTLKSHSNR